MAIMMMGLVAAAVAALATQLATSARQANTQREEAQAEQLLIAGIEIARQAKPNAAQSIKLPAALSEESASLKLTPAKNQVAIEAQVGKTLFRQPATP
jgi:type II secretory pathway component PulK